MWLYLIFGAVLQKFLFSFAILWFYKTKWFAIFSNFQVISMWFTVCLCYFVRHLDIYLCSFLVFIPPLRPPP